MPSADLISDVDRQLTICNACRYCEGYCAVFPAMATRRQFNTEDLVYMANLCFECRACYYACPYTPPHEYAVNIPHAFAELRAETYAEYTWPSLLSRLFQGNQKLVTATIGVFIALIFGSVLAVQGSDVMFGANATEGAFFEVVPYYAMVVPALIISIYAAGALVWGGLRFWRSSGASVRELFDVVAFTKASKDAFGLQYLKGGNAGGCFYPDRLISSARRWSHHLVFYGFLLTLASTIVAAIYHNLLDREAPYAYLSLPVVLGTAGGVMVCLGVGALFWLKSRQDHDPASDRMLQIDNVFLLVLLATNVSGLLLMVLRESALMPSLLAIHLGVVAAFFLTLPYGKFAHVVYRYGALIRYQIEMRREQEARAG